MREGLKLSSWIFLIGLLLLFQRITLIKLDFLSLLLLALIATFWCEGQMKNRAIRTGQWLAIGAMAYYSVSALWPVILPGGLGSLSTALFHVDHTGFRAAGAYAFLEELYAYATDPNKLDFYHWQYLWAFFVLLLSELLYQIHRKELGGVSFMVAFIASGLLWFSYLDVWAVFACCFTAYATERLTRQGKGALFGFVLPVGVTVAALLATGITPVETINDKLSPLTSEGGWLRTALNLSPGTGVFQLRDMGFYPLEDRLGGPVKLSKDIMFRIQSATPKIYLRGRVLTVYEDNQWQRLETEPKPFYTISGKQTKLIDYVLYDLKSKTNSVLVPMTVTDTDLPQDKLQAGRDGEVVYQGNLKSDFKDGFKISGYQSSYLGPVPEGVYLQLPRNYSKAVAKLTQEVIKDAKTDEEKIKRIRKYLLNNYTYALAVAVPPEDQDFVEYFLTRSDSGYCVYFASATAVMARIAGLPSRYVEGFVTPEQFEAGRDAAVSGERAHAWAEVFYDHQWQIVESTPTFTSLTAYDQEDIALKADFLEEEPDQAASKEEEDMAVALAGDTEIETKKGGLSLWFAGLFVLLTALAGLVHLRFRAYFRGDHLSSRGNRGSRGNKSSNAALTDKYVQLLLLGLTRHYDLRSPQQLSPREILRVCDGYAPSLNLMSLVEIVEKSLYDSSEISDQELELLAQTYWQLSRTRYSWGQRFYWYVKIAGKGRIFNGNDGKNSAS